MNCPDCNGFLFRPGPRGGLSQNFECVGCGARFNCSTWHGQLIDYHRIPAERDGGGEWREDMFPQVLQ
jgi:hypothetical protein